MPCKIIIISSDKENPIVIQTNLEEEDFKNPNEFNYPNEELKTLNTLGLQEDTSSYIPEDVYDLVSHFWINDSNLRNNSEQLTTAYLSNKPIEYEDGFAYLPTHTYQQLKQYSDIEFSPDMPPIIVLENNFGYGGDNKIHRIRTSNGYQYIVYDDNQNNGLKAFSKFSFQLQAIEQLRQGNIDISILPRDLVPNVLLNTIKQDIEEKREDKIQLLLEKNTRRIQTALDSRNKELAKLKEQLQYHKRLRDEKEYSYKNARKENTKAEYLRLQKLHEGFIKNIEKDIENLLIDIASWKSENPPDSNISRRLEIIKNLKGEFKYTTLYKFLLDYIHNKQEWSDNLLPATVTSIDMFLNTVQGHVKTYYTDNAFSTLIGKEIWMDYMKQPEYNRVLRYDIKQFERQLIQHKIIDKNSKLSNNQLWKIFIEKILTNHPNFAPSTKPVTDKQNYFYLIKKENVELFKDVVITSEDIVGFMNEEKVLKKMHDGYFITKHNNKYYVTDRPLNKYSKDSNSFTSYQQAVEFIDSIKENRLIYKSGRTFLYYDGKDITKVVIPSDIVYKDGEIIYGLNYPTGPIFINKTLKISDFNKWVQKLLTDQDRELSAIGRLIKNKIKTPQQIALFLTHVEMEDPTTNNSYFINNSQFIKKVTEEISASSIQFYKVVNNSYKETINKKTNNVVNIVKQDKRALQQIPKVFNRPYENNILNLQSIKESFKKYGVQIELLSNIEMENRFGKGTDGYYLNGIIYLNYNTATLHTALHEYTHLLLGLLRESNPQAYQKLIEKYISEYKGDFQGDLKNKQTLYSQSSESEVIEEMFADDFGKYLISNNQEISDLFEITKSSIEEHPIFNPNTNISELINNPISSFELFSNSIQAAKKEIGFSIPSNITRHTTLQNLLKQEIKNREDFNDNDLIVKDCI